MFLPFTLNQFTPAVTPIVVLSASIVDDDCAIAPKLKHASMLANKTLLFMNVLFWFN
jgi:hypothetical protein